MPKIQLLCPMCELCDVIVKDWRYSVFQGKNAPWVFCPKCKWKGFLQVMD